MATSDVESPNFDESKVPDFALPDLLRTHAGEPVADAEAWMAVRRREILELFREHVYGRDPVGSPGIRFELRNQDSAALGGTALRKEIRVHFTTERGDHTMDLLVYLPAGKVEGVPVFLGLNFYGNHTIHPDPGITLSDRWMRPNGKGVEINRATEAARGSSSESWPLELILSRGYGLATIYYGDLVPDHADGLEEGVPRLFREGRGRASDEWGAIGAWAWGLSRAMDYFATDPAIDERRVAVMGHSRLGKTALWAGACDPRFALVISNNSGCGGAAISRRRFGETVKRINSVFPHWFSLNFRQYCDREDDLPVDQHQLIALIAPRPVYVASATEDLWADPKGEFLAAKSAEPVYGLFGLDGLGVDAIPPPEQPVGHTIGYHLRTGRHGITEYDWRQFLDFSDRHL